MADLGGKVDSLQLQLLLQWFTLPLGYIVAKQATSDGDRDRSAPYDIRDLVRRDRERDLALDEEEARKMVLTNNDTMHGGPPEEFAFDDREPPYDSPAMREVDHEEIPIDDREPPPPLRPRLDREPEPFVGREEIPIDDREPPPPLRPRLDREPEPFVSARREPPPYEDSFEDYTRDRAERRRRPYGRGPYERLDDREYEREIDFNYDRELDRTAPPRSDYYFDDRMEPMPPPRFSAGVQALRSPEPSQSALSKAGRRNRQNWVDSQYDGAGVR